jgi:hypothetical protein
VATTQYQAIHDRSMQMLKNEVKQLHDVVEKNKGVELYCPKHRIRGYGMNSK